MKVCVEAGCPEIVTGRYCTTHARQHEQRRGSRQARGYTAEHYRLRAQWAARVATGTVHCARCHQPIKPTERWDLGHADDRTRYNGPEHADRCNRAAGGRAAHT